MNSKQKTKNKKKTTNFNTMNFKIKVRKLVRPKNASLRIAIGR